MSDAYTRCSLPMLANHDRFTELRARESVRCTTVLCLKALASFEGMVAESNVVGSPFWQGRVVVVSFTEELQ